MVAVNLLNGRRELKKNIYRKVSLDSTRTELFKIREGDMGNIVQEDQSVVFSWNPTTPLQGISAHTDIRFLQESEDGAVLFATVMPNESTSSAFPMDETFSCSYELPGTFTSIEMSTRSESLYNTTSNLRRVFMLPKDTFVPYGLSVMQDNEYGHVKIGPSETCRVVSDKSKKNFYASDLLAMASMWVNKGIYLNMVGKAEDLHLSWRDNERISVVRALLSITCSDYIDISMNALRFIFGPGKQEWKDSSAQDMVTLMNLLRAFVSQDEGPTNVFTNARHIVGKCVSNTKIDIIDNNEVIDQTKNVEFLAKNLHTARNSNLCMAMAISTNRPCKRKRMPERIWCPSHKPKQFCPDELFLH